VAAAPASLATTAGRRSIYAAQSRRTDASGTGQPVR
jgi:hypothetical protein